jgi:hypothetical protein
MKSSTSLASTSLAFATVLFTTSGFAQTAPAAAPAASSAGPYKVLNTAQYMGTGGIDYVNTDSVNRHVFVARGSEIEAYDMDTLKPAGTIPNVRAHGVQVDASTGNGFATSKPITMFDAKTLKVIKTIDVDGSPDGMFFEAFSGAVYDLSHSAPNVTVIDTKDGTVRGTIDLGGAPEEGCGDGKGKAYICVEDQNNVAVVDTKTLQVLAHYDLGDQGGQPAGLCVDGKNGIVFVYCRGHNNCLVLNAADGKIITSLPTGRGCDSAEFDPATMEAFSSQGADGTLAVIKENSPTDFVLEQSVVTKAGAKCSSLDAKTGHILLATIERAPAPAPAAASSSAAAPASTAASSAAPVATTSTPMAAAPVGSTPPAGTGQGGRRGGRGGNNGPGFLDLIVVGQ